MKLSGITELSLEQKIGQLFFIGIPGPNIDDVTERLIGDISPGGICLFARNIKDPVQTRSLLDSVRESLPVEPLLSIDQEGGLVDRLRRLLEPMAAASRVRSPDDASRQARLIAEALTHLGFNMDFAPVVDVIDERRSAFTNGLHSRAFGRSASDVISIAGRFLEVLQSNGIVGCVKHFPGLGASEVDSHEELPTVSIDEGEFRTVDLAPFYHLIGAGLVKAVMVAHAAFPALGLQETDRDGKLLPASLSSNFVTQLLRKELNFNGLVLTDDLEMGAILKNYGIGEASVMAIEAGHDMVCICAGVDAIRESYAAIRDAVTGGRISEERIETSVKRILELKSTLTAPPDQDPEIISSLPRKILEFNGSLS